MKQILTLIGVILLCGMLAACTAFAGDSSSDDLTQMMSSSSQPSQPTAGSQPEQQAEESQPEESATEPIVVADAAYYRGTVTAVEPSDEGQTVTLAQAKGTDFGAPVLQFLIDGDSKLSFEAGLIQPGAYLEVYYGMAPGEQLDPETVYGALAVNRLMEAEMVNFNGVLKELVEPDESGSGDLIMVGLEDEQEVIFHFSQETQFYLNLDELKAGDQLNIYHSGAYTRSLPPQGVALEVRPMAEEAAQ